MLARRGPTWSATTTPGHDETPQRRVHSLLRSGSRSVGRGEQNVSREKLEEILARAMEDGAFRTRLLSAPSDALAGYELSAQERQAFLAGSLRELLLTLDHDPGQ